MPSKNRHNEESAFLISQPTSTDNQPIQSSSAGTVIKRPDKLLKIQATTASVGNDHSGFEGENIHPQGGSSHQGHIRFTPEGILKILL